MPSTTRERGLILITEDVLAVMSGAKTQHRVPVKMRGIDYLGSGGRSGREWNDPRYWGYESEQGEWFALQACEEMCSEAIESPFPPGTMLYVRETWALDHEEREVCWRADRAARMYDLMSPLSAVSDVYYLPTKYQPDRWRSAATMPKWAARTWLRVTVVRVERLQEITAEDVRAEGCENRAEFECRWNEKHGWIPNAFADNPFVWVREFETVPN